MDDWVKKFFPPDADGPTGKMKILLIAVAVLGVLLLIWPVLHPKTNTSPVQVSTVSTTLPTTDLEQKLSAVLSSIQGAGQVNLTLFYASTGNKEYAVNKDEEIRETSETSQGGVKRTTKETRVSQQLAGDNKEGFLVDARSPEVVGALVVADGAGDPRVREEISDALSSLLDLPSHRITVLPRQ